MRTFVTTVAEAGRRAAVPLAGYYTVTLGIPLANGAAKSGAAFLEHALVVLVVPPSIIVLACVFHTIVSTVIDRSATWVVWRCCRSKK